MKEALLVFQNANYDIRYKEEKRSRDFHPIKNGVPGKLVSQTRTDYWVYFEDPKLREHLEIHLNLKHRHTHISRYCYIQTEHPTKWQKLLLKQSQVRLNNTFASMEFTPDLLLNQEKKAAHLRRASKFMDWLRQPEYGYSNYVDDASNDKLAKLTHRLIIWALEISMPQEHWEEFHTRFKAIRDLALTLAAEGITEEERYLYCIKQLSSTLFTYKTRIEEIYTQKITAYGSLCS